MKNKSFFISCFFFLTLLNGITGCSSWETKPDPRTAVQAVTDFYRDHLSTKKINLESHFSKSLTDLAKINEQTCVANPGSDICGWNASGDVFLDAQEYDQNLTIENSGFSAVEKEPGMVEVKLNVLPNTRAQSNKEYYNRKLRYHMVREDGNWVINDMITKGKSLRQQMQHEINFYYLKK